MSYLTNFVPARGDVTYGISATCGAYRSRFESYAMSQAKLHDEGSEKAHYWSEQIQSLLGGTPTNRMDVYNNYFGVPSIAAQKTAEAVTEHLKGKQAALPEGKPTYAARLKAYAEGIEKSRYAPSSVFGESPERLGKEGYTKDHFTSNRWLFKDTEKTAKATMQNQNYLAIRRACKFGIGLVATDDTFRDAKVHFALDSLDLKLIADKTDKISAATGADTDVKKHFNHITYSELRYVFRNWGKLSDKVILYVNLQPVAAPWLSDWGPLDCVPGSRMAQISACKAEWDKYAERRRTKYEDAGEDVENLKKGLLGQKG